MLDVSSIRSALKGPSTSLSTFNCLSLWIVANGSKKVPILESIGQVLQSINKLDEDTYGEDSVLGTQRKEHIKKQGEIFYKASLYLNEYYPFVKAGQSLMRVLSKTFETFYESFNSTHTQEECTLSEKDKHTMDTWFFGKEISEIIPVSIDTIEEKRIELLQEYFRLLSQGAAFSKETVSLDQIQGVQLIISKRIIELIHLPEVELFKSIFENGMKKLKEEMHGHGAEETTEGDMMMKDLYDKLQIPYVKNLLMQLKTKGSYELCAEKEREMMGEIQKQIYAIFPVTEMGHSEDFYMNMRRNALPVVLEGALLDELGMTYVKAELFGSPYTIVVCSDGTLFLNNHLYGNYVSDQVFSKQDVSHISNFAHQNTVDATEVILHKEFEKDSAEVMVQIYKPSRGMELELLNHLAEQLMKINKVHFAEVAFIASERALFIQEDNRTALHNLAMAQVFAGQYEKAAYTYKRLFSLEPHYFPAILGYGTLLVQLKKYKEAIDVYEKSVRFYDDSAIYLGLSHALEKDGQYTQARSMYEKYLLFSI